MNKILVAWPKGGRIREACGRALWGRLGWPFGSSCVGSLRRDNVGNNGSTLANLLAVPVEINMAAVQKVVTLSYDVTCADNKTSVSGRQAGKDYSASCRYLCIFSFHVLQNCSFREFYPTCFLFFCVIKRVAVISAKNHKRQRRKRQSVTAKREKSQTPKVLTAILTLPNLT